MRHLFVLIWLVVSLGANASQTSSAQQWFERMHTALTQAHFQYSLVQMHRDQIRALRYAHGVVDEQRIAYLEHLNGPAKSVVQVGSQVTYLEHDVAPYSVVSDHIHGFLPAAFFRDLNSLQPHYQFVEAGRNRVAGRTAQLLRIVPRDQFRYQYRVWLDVESALPLRVDLIDEKNELLEQTLVIEVAGFSEPPPLLSELSARQWPSTVSPPEMKGFTGWRFGWLPDGFEVTHYDQHLLLGLKEPVEYLSLSDGLADFSVYIGLVGQVEMPRKVTATSGLALASAIHGDIEVVAVGKMPVDALTNVASNIYPAAPGKESGQ